MPTYTGGCHCGAVRFEATGTLEGLERCNCSLCTKWGFLHWYVPPADFTLLSGEDQLETYRFGTMTSRNPFCRRCGVMSFRTARSDPDLIDINLRCIDDLDAESLPYDLFDGQNWEAAYKERRGEP